MFESALSDQIESLRVQLESSLPTPMMLVISSAQSDDGSSVVASELARTMHAAGNPTLLVTADNHVNPGDGLTQPRSLDDINGLGLGVYTSTSFRTGTSVLSIPSAQSSHTVSRDAMLRFAKLCRSSYSVTIIDAPEMLGNSFAMLAALSADRVMLAIREGRRVAAVDRKLAQTLVRDRVPFLGVVTVAPAIIHNEQFGLPRKRVVVAKDRPTVPAEPARREQAV